MDSTQLNSVAMLGNDPWYTDDDMHGFEEWQAIIHCTVSTLERVVGE